MQSLSLRYLQAKATIIEAGYGDEICWQATAHTADFDEQIFLRESAWVILSSGMRESVIRKKFPMMSKAFCDWKCAKMIWEDRRKCTTRAATVFKHQGKIHAILTIAEYIAHNGIESLRSGIEQKGPEFLQMFPYLGPATSYHLAKNLGLEVAKPDRHLLRFAHALGFEDPHELCTTIATEVGDRIAVVDLVLWRYATLQPNYELGSAA